MNRRLMLLSALALPVTLGAAAPPPAASPAPERGVTVVLETISGRVDVRPAEATRYRRLTAARELPVGVTVDAQEGAVRLTVARDDDGGTWRAVFSEGKFTVLQPRGGAPLTTLRLTGPSYADTCDDDDPVASRRKPRRVRRLWGDGKGDFRTSGRYAAATVRGTRWLTEDRCDGTLTKVVRGEVDVEDFTYEPPEPAPPTAPVPGSPQPGSGEASPAPPPAVRPVTDGSGPDIRVAAGGTYVARP